MRVVLLVFVLISFFSSAKQLTIAIGDYPPFAGETIEQQGVVPRIVRAAFAKQGYTVVFEFMPWGRSFASALKGNYDAAAFWFCVPERKKDFYCSEPLYHEATYFYYHKNKPLEDWQKLADLKGFNIGATTGYSYTDEFWQLATNAVLKVDTVTTDEQNLKKLLKGRIDLFPMATVPATYLLNAKFTAQQRAQLAYHPKPLFVSSSHLLFLKERTASKQLLAEFNLGLAALKQSGEYEVILNSISSAKKSSTEYWFLN